MTLVLTGASRRAGGAAKEAASAGPSVVTSSRRAASPVGFPGVPSPTGATSTW